MLSEKYKNILIISTIIISIIIVALSGYIIINKIKLSIGKKEATEFVAEFRNLIKENSEEIKYKESKVAGIIEIPNIDAKIPILEEAKVNIPEETVQILTGVGLNKIGNTVIIGQSYYKGTAFHDIEKLKLEEEINITDITGNTKTYIIYNIYKTNIEDKKYITENSKGNTRITLITNIDNDMLVIQANAK